MATLRTASLCLVLLAACDPNVVDAVREGAMKPVEVPVSPVKSMLIHRYSFDGTGTEVTDSKFSAHGQVIAAELPGSGALRLEGGTTGQYVDLPDKLIRGLGDATFEAWVTWSGGPAWQRIFDFGNGENGEDADTGAGTSYLFFTASSGVSVDRNIPTSALRAAYSQNGVSDEEPCQGLANLPVDMLTHVALVVDQTKQTMTIYQNGKKQVSCTLVRPLSAIDDVNNWLGRSNYSGDADFEGSFDEFRIYSAALSDEEIADSERAGPDAGLE